MPLLATFAGASARGLGFQAGAAEIPGLQLISTQSFSSASDVDFDNVFSNDYVQYKVVVDLTAGTGEFRGQWRASGSDITAASYTQQNIFVGSTSVTGQRITGATIYQFGNASAYDMLVLEILNPFQTTYASMVGSFGVNGENAGIASRYEAFGYSATTSFDGIRFYPEFGTFSGTISILGYYKG